MKFLIAFFMGINMLLATVVVFDTSEGVIELELFERVAPKTCENFVGLAKDHYYDNTIFHRIIPNFMIQGGDPTGTGRGGTSIWEKPFEDEIDPNVVFNEPGLLAMANSGPNTNGSQFFITTVKTSWLNGSHTIFGKVKKGMDVVMKISDAGTQSGVPQKDVFIKRAFVKDN